MLMRQYEKTMVLVEELALQVPGMEEILKIKGLGLITAAGFIAEVGDITRFEHPKQVQKLGGLSLKERKTQRKNNHQQTGAKAAAVNIVPGNNAAGGQKPRV